MRSAEEERGEGKGGYKEVEWRRGKFNPRAVGP
jgi:hypothetical protein